jgi:hypothetical protein
VSKKNDKICQTIRIRRRNAMDKKEKKFEKMAEMMKNCCKEEGSMADCCAMMKKMMGCGEGRETTEEKKDTGETV